jgi:hypothetical protein
MNASLNYIIDKRTVKIHKSVTFKDPIIALAGAVKIAEDLFVRIVKLLASPA